MSQRGCPTPETSPCCCHTAAAAAAVASTLADRHRCSRGSRAGRRNSHRAEWFIMFRDSEHAAQTRESGRGGGRGGRKGDGRAASRGFLLEGKVWEEACVWGWRRGGCLVKSISPAKPCIYVVACKCHTNHSLPPSACLLSVFNRKARGDSEPCYHRIPARLSVQTTPGLKQRGYQQTHLQSIKPPLLPLCSHGRARTWPGQISRRLK